MSEEKTFSQKLSIGKESLAESDNRATISSRNSSPSKSPKKIGSSPKKNSGSSEPSKFSLKFSPKSPAKGKLVPESCSKTQINSTPHSPSTAPSPTPPQASLSTNNTNKNSVGGSPKRFQFHSTSPSKTKSSDKSQGQSGASSSSQSFGTTARPEIERSQSVRLTRKIFHNWRSACGRTKDKTKDFIRRWKTLPENHPDFDHLSGSPQGSTTNIDRAGTSTQQHQHLHGESSSLVAMASTAAKVKSMVTKKLSDNEILVVERERANGSHDEGTHGNSGSGLPSGPHNKSSAGWSVHVWATYVQRGSVDGDGDVDTQEEKPSRELLSDFQKVKLTHFFRHVLDMNHDDVIAADDFVALNQRIRHYVEWSSECIEFHILKEVHSGFLECFLNQPLDEESHMFYCSSERETRHHVNTDEWLDVWGAILNPARNIEGLPLWLQYFPKILFQVINKSGSGTISKEELRAFYTMFLGIDFRVVNETLDSIYSAMTDGGRSTINYSLFKLCFANFLLAKYPHGPGQFLFGICAPQTLQCSFPIDYSALNTPPDDLEPYDPEKDKEQCNRRSVIV